MCLAKGAPTASTAADYSAQLKSSSGGGAASGGGAGGVDGVGNEEPPPPRREVFLLLGSEPVGPVGDLSDAVAAGTRRLRKMGEAGLLLVVCDLVGVN